jgi:hypothetical protein
VGNEFTHDELGQIDRARFVHPGADSKTEVLFYRNKAGMSLKTRGRREKRAGKPGISMKTKVISQSRRESCS